ncbi:MAG: hypothetical protein WBD40_12105 [Tepidisphaeraceae bacterium]
MQAFAWMVLTSLKSPDEVNAQRWVPAAPQWHNYPDVFDKDHPDPHRRRVDFARFYWNSLFVAAWVTFLQVFTSSMAAFSFSRLAWRGRDTVFFMYLGTPGAKART